MSIAGDSFIYEVSEKVKGPFRTGNYAAGDIVFNNGSWIESPTAGYAAKFGNDLYTRSSSVVENYQSGQSIRNGDVIEYDGKWYKVDGSGLLDISVASEDDLNAEVAAGNLSTGQLVQKDGNIEVFSTGGHHHLLPLQLLKKSSMIRMGLQPM